MTTVLLLLVLMLVAWRVVPVPASLQAHPSSWPPPLPAGCYRMIRADGTSVVVDIDELGPDHRAELEQAMAIVRRIADTQGRLEHG